MSSNQSTTLPILYQRIRHYPQEIQRQIIQLYICYTLRQENLVDIQDFCKTLLRQNANVPGELNISKLAENMDSFTNNPAKINEKVGDMLSLLSTESELELDLYEKLDYITKELGELKSTLVAIADNTKHSASVDLRHLVEKIEKDKIAQKKAMSDAAQQLFDRIFKSLNPENMEKQIDQNKLKVGPLKKAELYEIVEEKYYQLFDYHQNGKFVRDFKVNYKQNLKKNS